MNAIRIVIADDHPVFRFGLRALLNAMPDTEVVGEATSGEEVIALAGSVRPDVILMDINMPGVNGIEATRRIRETNPDICILIVTMLEDDSLFAAMRAGARGYVVKGAEPSEVLRAIRAVADGEAIFSPGIAVLRTVYRRLAAVGAEVGARWIKERSAQLSEESGRPMSRRFLFRFGTRAAHRAGGWSETLRFPRGDLRVWEQRRNRCRYR